MGSGNSHARAIERICVICSLLGQYDVDAYMQSCDPEKVRIYGTEKDIVAVYVNQRDIGKRAVVKRGGSNVPRQG